jgi:hypothetical protein
MNSACVQAGRCYTPSFYPQSNKVLTYVEYRAVPGVFQNDIDPPPAPLSTQRVCPLPASKAGAQSHIFTRDETGSVYLPTQLEPTLQLYW